MVISDKILHAIFTAIEEINHQQPQKAQLDKSIDTVLFGKSGNLDSLGLVNLVVAVEEHIEKDFGVTITLADERALSQESSPFRTIGTLADYIYLLLNNNENV